VTGLLDGMRVLDAGIWRPVPHATQMLADLGAHVLKIEPPGGDPMRTFPHLFRDVAGQVRLLDRGLNDITADLPEVVAAAKRIPPGSVIDGELVATDSEGRPDYPRLRERLAGGAALKDKIPTAYLAFDALFLEEKPLVRQPVMRRRARLSKAVEAGGKVGTVVVESQL